MSLDYIIAGHGIVKGFTVYMGWKTFFGQRRPKSINDFIVVII